ncbi:hypothetical protein FS418_12220 [Shewanella sp. YLB-09]|uniref:Transposase n=1 Tax=Shewanella eurypsychrophilus TaxID=2593656 RepID=A0A550AMW1_9GAMM|nr:hypothetical protein FS418_12220 [Shewanella sp. YLB-09]
MLTFLRLRINDESYIGGYYAPSRSTQISIEDTPYYHCCSRTVRHVYLTGVDDFTGMSIVA